MPERPPRFEPGTMHVPAEWASSTVYGELAVRLAKEFGLAQRSNRVFPVGEQLQASSRSLQTSYAFYANISRQPDAAIPPCAEWLLDNYYIVRQAFRYVKTSLPRDYYLRLPTIDLGNDNQAARIYLLARSLVCMDEGRLSAEALLDFLRAYQSVRPLKIGEIWAFASMLRLCLLEMLAASLSHSRHVPFEPPRPADVSRFDEVVASFAARRQPSDDDAVVSNCVVGLRFLDTQDWRAFFESASWIEVILSADPASVYSSMDFDTRNRYRNEIEALALQSPLGEAEIAQRAVELAQQGNTEIERHVGYSLIGPSRGVLERLCGCHLPLGERLKRWLKRHALTIYIGSVTALTLVLCAVSALYALRFSSSLALILLAFLLFLFPASDSAVHVVHWAITTLIPPRPLPKLDLSEGIPAEFGTLVVVPAIVKRQNEIQSLARQLENHFIGNVGPYVHFALLTDFYDAPQKEMPGDEALLKSLRENIARLNSAYGSETYQPFLLLHRGRTSNPGESCCMGWERKRGKLDALNKLLTARDATGFSEMSSDVRELPPIRYVITVDADTVLPRDAARRLVGTLAHPLNRAEFAPSSTRVVAGYTVLQPRIQVRSEVANLSLFTRVFSGDASLDLYSRAVSDVYQDLFGEGNYVGKGIYDVAAFDRCLRRRVPDNAILSHDLFEGLHGRCGLATDITIYEDYPPHYLAYSYRLHRWIRGDWQLLPWVFSRQLRFGNNRITNDLSLLDRWKILDNLRRSLAAPATLLFLLAAWFVLPGSSLVWTLLAFSPYLLALFTNLVTNLRARRPEDAAEIAVQPVRRSALRLFMNILFLPHEALIAADAITATLNRLFITHRHLLQWTTAAHTISIFGHELKIAIAWRKMISTPLFAAAALIGLLAWRPVQLWAAAFLLVLWGVSPYAAVHISQPLDHSREQLGEQQVHQLRMLARLTWLFFERFVGPEDHWLPPDHFQEEPRGVVAHRTSPTNIGLLMVSTLSAYDMGYMGAQELALRLRSMFDTLKLLARDRGHFLNWYDTHTLAPLPARYISTVDSGNLAACLLVIKQGLKEVATLPVVNWDGLVDTLDMLAATIAEGRIGRESDDLHAAIQDLRTLALDLARVRRYSAPILVDLFNENQAKIEACLIELVERSGEKLDQGFLNRLSMWVDRTRSHIESVQRDLRSFTPWSLGMANLPSLLESESLPPHLSSAWHEMQELLSINTVLSDIPATCQRARELLATIEKQIPGQDEQALAWRLSFEESLLTAQRNAQSLLKDLEALEREAEEFFSAMDFHFLFDPRRQVFHIGFNLEAGRLDANYYDLLASEARIASLVAIGKGDVPQGHWVHLARPLTQVQGRRTLLSWSSTMFEYLMPALFLRSYPGTLLDDSCRAVVDHQIAYGREKGVPWGISESSYYSLDANQAYQYRAFGVPGLGYKRGLEEDLVIAPYASALSLPFAPSAFISNLEHLRRLNLCGAYGLYEAVDFTPGRLGAGQEYAVVRSYMAHHQGMSLITLDNYLRDNKMVARFHEDARIRNVELLLQEQMPVRTEVEAPRQRGLGIVRPMHARVALESWSASPNAPYPQVHVLSNGSYSLLITATGSGYSSWQSTDLTRWRVDTTLDHWGSWLYLRDLDSGLLWSAAAQPVNAPPENQKVEFYPHRVEFERRDADISVHTHVAVAAHDDVEIRLVSITNHGVGPRRLLLTSYSEIILAPQDVDRRHPAFNKLFTESEYVEEGHFLLFHRRPRALNDKPVYLAHLVVSDDRHVEQVGYESDRAHFLGLGGNVRNPAALSDPEGLSRTTGATLDPACAIQTMVTLPPYETVELAYLTLAAASRGSIPELVQRYRQWNNIQNAFTAAGVEAESEMRLIGLTAGELELVQKLLSALLCPTPALRAEPGVLAANTLGQPGLWPFSISGDHPILLVRVKQMDGLQLLSELLRAHTYWRRRGLLIDLVVLNTLPSGYDDTTSGEIFRLLKQGGSETWLNKPGGIFVLREDQLKAAEAILLATAARVVLDDGAGTLEQQLKKLDEQPVRLPHFIALHKPRPAAEILAGIERPSNLLFDNGMGGFSPDGREYVIYLKKGQWTPAPWVNVIANPQFGFLVSGNGMGSTWAGNSGENRLTPWHNDPVSEPPSEAVYLRDEDTGQVWSPTPLPARDDAPYLIRHGAGYSIFEHESQGILQEMCLFALPDQPVKIVQLKLRNQTSRTRRINVTYYAEWVLGNARDITAQYIVPEFDSRRFALLARNPYNVEFARNTAFLAATRELNWLTTDRTEFLGVLGDYSHPTALDRVGLSANVRAGADPCAAVQLLMWLAAGEEKEVAFLIGQGTDREHAQSLISQFQDFSNTTAARKSVVAFWNGILETTQVKTPDPAMDLLLNRWLLYEALSSRIWGRTAFYQSSGAFGFRDQLQDVLALLGSRPDITRAQILDAARRQFELGDVLHWWHPPSGRGIRTRISDNLLWLPYVTAEYVASTSDLSILSEQIPYLSGEALKEGEEERYGQFSTGPFQEPLYEHCLRAIDRGVTAGQHGLPLMAAGDWNDGMNRVGVEGKGESIWLGWFAYAVLRGFAGVCEQLGDVARAGRYRNQADVLARAIEEHGWDGEWYRRAYFDDGTALGSAERMECRIDSISQSWAVLSGAAGRERAHAAMESLYKNLVRPEDGLLLLLTPPFNLTLRDPGYIKGYPPGIRENGGQYTHAALWAVWAFAELGQGDVAVHLFDMLNPIHHADTSEKMQRYRAEPYVVAADVYSEPPHIGRGGWTWYTGSASWMYRLGVEGILGIKRKGDRLSVSPSIPQEWKSFEVRYRFGETVYQIHVENSASDKRSTPTIHVDGVEERESVIRLRDDHGRHVVQVRS